MKAKGSMTSRHSTPVISTTTENSLPGSEVKVMSPKPSVVMTVSVQYRPVIQE